MNTGKFVVFDGMDGSGKGTQIELLKRELGDSVVFTREPGGPPLAEEIRKIVRDNPLAANSTALFHFLGFWMAREESMQQVVMPALMAGKNVFSDRGDSSTFAFQLYGEDVGGDELLNLFPLVRKLVFNERERREPDLYIVFDLPPAEARRRALQDASRAQTHFDARDLGYYERVSLGFHTFAKMYPVKFVDATRSPEEVHRRVQMVLAAEMVVPEYAFIID